MSVARSKIGSFVNNANSTLDQLTAVAQGILCIPSTLSAFLTNSGSIPGTVARAGGAIAATVTNVVGVIVQNEIATIGNLFAQALQQQYQVIRDIFSGLQSIVDLVFKFGDKVGSTVDYIKNAENCAYSTSQLLSCVLGAATNLRQEIRKPAENLDAFNNRLVEITSGNSGIIDNYVSRNMQGVDRAKMQLALQSYLP